jgi:ankyrin repeat protein
MFRQKLRHAFSVLTFLVWCGVAFSDEFEDAAKVGDYIKLRALLKNGHKFNEFLTAHRAGNSEKESVLMNEDPKLIWAIVFLDRGEIQDEAGAGNLERVRTLLKNDPNLASSTNHEEGMTPLHCAVKNGHEDVVKLLLASNANVNATSLLDGTPLCLAVIGGYTDIAKLLLDNHADVNATNCYGQKPLHLATCAKPDMAELLLAHGADVNAKDQYGETPMFRAASLNNKGMIELLLDHKADINEVGDNGKTPLQAVVEYNNQDMAKYLIKHGARDATNSSQAGTIKEAVVAGD